MSYVPYVRPWDNYGDYDKWLQEYNAAQAQAQQNARNELDIARTRSNAQATRNSLAGQLHNQKVTIARQPVEIANLSLNSAQQQASAASRLASLRLQAQRMQASAMQQGNVMNQNYGAAIARRLLGF